MTLPAITIAVVLAVAIVCTVVAASLADSTTNVLLAVAWGVVPLLMIVQMWHPPLRPAFAGIPRNRLDAGREKE